MNTQTILAFTLYFIILIIIGLTAHWRHRHSSGSITSSRSLNYWVTAISAHASDMSNWLFMGLPAAVFVMGLFQAWTAIGLVTCMFLNWHFIAPRLRRDTEHYKCFSLAGYFAARLNASAGFLHIITFIASLLFFTVYVSAGFVGMGILFETLFGIPYGIGIFIGIVVILIYTFVGGYVAVAWTDLFQGLFLLAVIILVPLYILGDVGGIQGVKNAIIEHNLSLTMIPDFSLDTIINIILLTLGWGMGYFGQPHILSKFMGLKNPNEMHKSKYVGSSWLILSLFSGVAVGLVAIPFFNGHLAEPDLVFISMVRDTFTPFLTGLILSGILAATISTIDSQILVLAHTITEDFYQRLIRRNKAPLREMRFVSRVSIIVVIITPFIIAMIRPANIYDLVLYSWTGLGASFGPLIIMCLYSKRVNKYGAIAGLFVGTLMAAIWPILEKMWLTHSVSYTIPGLVPSFILSILTISIVSRLTTTTK